MDEQEKQIKDKNTKVLRTFTSDMADAIRTNEMSVIKIALAEKEKREREEIYKEAEGTNTSKTLWIIGGIILIIGAVIGSYFLIQSKKQTPQATVVNIDTFISYDSQVNIDVTSATNAESLLNLIKQGQQTNTGLPAQTGLIKALFLNKKLTDVSEILKTKDFLLLIDATEPEALLRSLSDKYLLGEYNRGDKSSMFLIFETTNYPQAYASMLDWEKTILKDLFTLFSIDVSLSNSSLLTKPWEDIIINNKDARVLYGENGQAILYYLFVNKNDFIITGNIEALKEVTARLITKNTKPL